MPRPICEAIKAARERAGLTQRQVAEYCAVSQPTVHDWERDREPSLDQLVDLALIFGLPRDQLLRDAGYVRDATPSPEEAIRADRSLQADARAALLGALAAYRARGDV